MFEDLAIELALLFGAPGAAPKIIFASLMLCGCIVGIHFRRTGEPMARIPFFALTTLQLMAFTALMLVVDAFEIPALLGGYVWITMTALTLSILGYGYATGRIDAARALDSFGSKWAALIGLVPGVNLVLVLKRSRTPDTTAAPRFLSGGAGLGIGVVATIATIAANVVLARSTPLTPDRKHQLDIAMLEHNIRYRGAGTTAQSLVAAVKAPAVIDASVTLVRFESDGTSIWRDLSVDLPADFVFGEIAREQVIRQTCADDWMARLLKGGLRMEVRFIRRVADITDVVTVDENACNSLPAAPTAAS